MHDKIKYYSMYCIISLIIIVAITITCIFRQCITLDTLLLFWGAIIGGIATLTAVVFSVQKNWEHQTNIFKQDIKIQLFDKRYSVYKALIEADALIKRPDTIKMLLSETIEPYEFKKKIYEYNDNLREKAHLSEAIFDKTIYNKMMYLSSLYHKVFEGFMDLIFKTTGLFKPLSEQQGIALLEELDSYINNNMESSTDNINFNSIHHGLDEVLSPCLACVKEFNNYFYESGVIKDFDKYLLIKDMDR